MHGPWRKWSIGFVHTLAFLLALCNQSNATGLPPCLLLPSRLDDQAMKWIRMDDREGILAADEHVIAFVEFSGVQVAIRAPFGDRHTFPAQGLIVDSTAHIAVPNARLSIGENCVVELSIDARLVEDRQLRLQATALRQLEAAEAQKELGQVESAARQAELAFDTVADQLPPCHSTRVLIASATIERLLDAGSLQLATRLFESIQACLFEPGPLPDGVLVLGELAHARLLSFEGNRFAALAARERLQSPLRSIFHEGSPQCLWNELRIANLLLELGQSSKANAVLSTFSLNDLEESADVSLLGINARIARANLAAIEGSQAKSLAEIALLFTQASAALGDADPRTIEIEAQLGRAQLRRNRPDDAVISFSDVFLWRQKHSISPNTKLLETGWLLARLYNDLGRFDSAYALLVAVLDGLEREPQADQASLKPRVLAGLASVQASRGELRLSEDLWIEALSEFEKQSALGPDEYLGIVFNYSLISILNGHSREICSTWIPRATGIAHNLSVDPHTKSFARILQGLCEGYSGDAGQIDLALRHVELGRRELQLLDGIESESSLYCLTLLAAIATKANREDAAIGYLEDLLHDVEASYQQFGGPDRRMTAFWLSKWIRESTTSVGYASLAMLLARKGDLTKAISISDLARSPRQDAHDDFPAKPAGFGGGNPMRSADPGVRALDEELSRTPDVVRRIEIESKRLKLVKSSDIEHTRDNSQGNSERLGIAKERHLDLGSLPVGSAIVSIHHAGENWWAIVIGGNGQSHFVPFPGAGDLGTIANAWFETRNGGARNVWKLHSGEYALSYVRPDDAVNGPIPNREIERVLVARLWSPLFKYVRNCRQIGVIADDELQRISLGSLRTGDTYLVDKYEFVYGSSISSLLEKFLERRAASWEHEFLGVSDDSYQAAGAGSRTESSETTTATPESSASHRNTPIGKPFAQAEVSRILEMFSPTSAVSLRGEDGGRERLVRADQDHSLKGYRFVHLAAHFSTSMNFLREPEIGIGGGLTATELSHFSMASDVIVLSGCNSAIGPSLPEQGMASLGRAALSAGNRAAVVTVAPIPEDIGAVFMSSLYREFADGTEAPSALAKVQREFAHSDDARKRDPSIWGAYIVME